MIQLIKFMQPARVCVCVGRDRVGEEQKRMHFSDNPLAFWW